MNLNQIRFACAIASSGSFTAAANNCFVTQPTLSNSVAQLEEELGERIFVRTTRKVSLTLFGIHILPYLNEVLNAQSTLQQQVQAFLSPTQRLIRIGMSPLVNAQLLGLMIEPFQRDHPNLDIVLREMNMSDLHRMLESGLLDFVFGVSDSAKTTWASTPLYRESLFFIPRGNLPLTMPNRQNVRLTEIADETYVMVPDACGLSRATRALFRSHRRKLKEYSGEAMSYQVLEEWAALGIGAAILPRSKLAAHKTRALPIVDKVGQEIDIAFEAIWPGKNPLAKHLADFAEHLKTIVPAIVAGLTEYPPGKRLPAHDD